MLMSDATAPVSEQGAGVEAAGRAAALARVLRKRVNEASYLVAENAERYRPIMRFFYEQHMSHRYTLQPGDVLVHMRELWVPGYTEAQCEQDLRQLCEWGNLAAEQDRSRVHTLEEFLCRRLLYNITPYGIAFERLLVELEEERGTRGSLDIGLLEMLLAAVETLSPLLDQLPPAAPATQSWPDNAGPPYDESVLRKVQRAWSQAYDMFDRIGKQASDYLGALDRSRHDDTGDLAAFLAYKDLLLQYLQAFVTSLLDHGEKVVALLSSWPKLGKVERLLAGLVVYDLRYNPPPDGRTPDPAELRARHERAWQNLYHWFQPRGGLNTLRRRTTGAIERVVRQSQRLMDRRSGVSRRRDLEQLAVLFAACADTGEGHRLAGLALGCATPRHVQGSAEVYTPAEKGSVWEMSPQDIPMQPIQRGGRRPGRSVPVLVHDSRQGAVLQEELARRHAAAAVWDELFIDGRLDLGCAYIADPAVRAQVLAILAACLASPTGEALAPDGSRIRLLPPPAGESGRLSSRDGALYLPAFVLLRELPRHTGMSRSTIGAAVSSGGERAGAAAELLTVGGRPA